MSKTKKIISIIVMVALVMTMATVAMVSTSAATKVYFENSLNWDTVYAYCYGGNAGEALGTWGGTQCTDEGNGIWSIELSAAPECIIFHANDDANQTSNIPYAGENMIAKLTGEWIQGDYKMVAVAEFEAYEGGEDTPVVTPSTNDEATDDEPAVSGETMTLYFENNWLWPEVSMYYWGDATGENAEWPGEVLTDVVGQNADGYDIYKFEVPAEIDGIVFSGEGEYGRDQSADVTELADGLCYYMTYDESTGEKPCGSYEYAVADDTPVVTDPVDEPVVTDPVDEPVVTDPVDEPVVTDPVDEPASSDDEEPVVEPEKTVVIVNGVEYDVVVGDTITYTVKLTAAELFENIQAIITYDADKLELVRKTDDPELLEEEIACPVLGDAIFNADVEGVVKFNASKVKGYDFKEEGILVTLDFIVKDAGQSEIDLVIEEMTIKGDGTQSYFTGGEAVITDGISVVETLDVPEHPVETEPVETEPVETEPVETEPVETVPAPSEDETSATDAPEVNENDTVTTGVATYIYIAIAMIAMAACAVVVLRKKVNG